MSSQECKILHDPSVMRLLSSRVITTGDKGTMGGSCSKADKYFVHDQVLALAWTKKNCHQLRFPCLV